MEYACQHGQSDIISLMLSKCPDAAKLPDAFKAARDNNQLDVVQQLLDAGAADDIQFMTHIFTDIPLTLHPVAQQYFDLMLSNSIPMITGNAISWYYYTNSSIKSDHYDQAMKNIRNRYNIVELFIEACDAGCLDIVDFCISVIWKQEFEPDVALALEKALVKGHTHVADRILTQFQIDLTNPAPFAIVPVRDSSKRSKITLYGRSILSSAVTGGCADVVKKLLDSGRWDSAYGDSLISSASDPAVVQMLLDVNVPVFYARSHFNNRYRCKLALTAACKKLQPASVKMLLDAGAVFDAGQESIMLAQSVISHRPHTDAEQSAQIAVLRLLLERWSATITPRDGPFNILKPCHDDDKPWDKLMHCCVMRAHRTSSSAICDTLLHHYPDTLDCPLGSSYTPIMTAIEWKHTEMITALLNAGADVPALLEKRGCYMGSLLYPWFKEPSLDERDDFVQIVGSRVGKHMHDTLRIILNAGIDPTVYSRDPSEHWRMMGWGVYKPDPSDMRTVIMDIIDPPIECLSSEHASRLYTFPDSDCSVFIAMILDAVLAQGTAGSV
jgi:hypothetical protein